METDEVFFSIVFQNEYKLSCLYSISIIKVVLRLTLNEWFSQTLGTQEPLSFNKTDKNKNVEKLFLKYDYIVHTFVLKFI